MDKEINIKKLVYVIRKRIWIVIALSILFALLGGVYSMFFTKPLYESSSRLIVNAEPELMNTLMVMIEEPSFLEYVVGTLNLDTTPENLSEHISAESIEGSSIVKISVVDEDPKMAKLIADTTAMVFQKEIPKLLEFKDISIFSTAKVSSDPINDDHETRILLGLVVGALSGIGLIFLMNFFDNTIKSEREVELLLNLPVFGSISKMDSRKSSTSKYSRYKVLDRRASHGAIK
ncbi:hypothetical protein HHO41_11235 [Bacillus sp. DNRA2]|uniref:Wzz/FepE/Etk N-terminal domain-containing protein n=1 Tax=Bacillus sp. DNRA2 TaxID=2723053 RepID=UPI00145CD8E0|nr:hypothetical protein [Bacillus sp. DNRA2]